MITVIIPTLNEEASIGEVVRAVPRDLVDRIIVADGGSTDATAAQARNAGADVLDTGLANSVSGMVRPSALAVLRLITISIFVRSRVRSRPAHEKLPHRAHREFAAGRDEIGSNGSRLAYFAATAMWGHSSICTRATSL
jgi:glycosyltransferase involved in cell wall biosynthesis